MEIRPDISLKRAGKVQPKKGKKESLKNSVSFNDKVTLGEEKPGEMKKITPGSAGVSQEKKTSPALAGSYLQNAAASATLSGSLGAAMQNINAENLQKQLETLSDKGIGFYQLRTWRFPFVMGKYKEVEPEEAARIISGEKSNDSKNLKVKTPSTTYLPMDDAGDVKELEGFYSTGTVSGLKNRDMARFLKDAESSGLQLKDSDGSNVGAYGAYNLLTTGWEKSGREPSAVNLIREGVLLMKITPQKARDPFQVKKELKDAWKAFNELQSYGSRYLNEVGRPINDTPFTNRFEIFKNLEKNVSRKNALTAYTVIADSTGPKEDFKKVAGYFLDLEKKVGSRFDHLELMQAFNYARANLKGKPPLQQAYVEIINGTGDINDSIRGLQMITTPVNNETFWDRKDAMKNLVDTAGSEGVNMYEVVKENLLPGENVKSAADEFCKMYREVSDRFYSDTARRQTPKAFSYMRTDLAGDKERREIYRDMFMSLGHHFKTLKIMGKLEESFRDTTYRERAEVLTGLLKHEDSEKALKDFEFIKAHTGKKEKLADVGKTFVDLLSAARDSYYSSQKARKAFKYTRDKLKNDPSKIRSFTRILEKSTSYEDTVKIYEHIQKPVKNEDYKMREKVALRLMELELHQWQRFEKVYDTIGRHIYSGEDLKKVTEQFVAIYQAQGDNSYYYEKSLEAFTDMKEKSKTDRKSFDRYINVLKVLKDVDRTREAMNLLNRPVKNESYDDREAVLLEQYKTLQDSDNSSKEAIENYRVISSKIDKSETLKQANFRFRKLSDVLDGRKNPEKVRDAFSFIADEMKDGTFPGKSVKEVTDMLVKALLVSDSLSDAKDYLIHQQNPGKDGKIEKEDGFVVIGGVKLPVRN